MLPDDIVIYHIFEHLLPLDQISFSQTSKRFFHLCKQIPSPSSYHHKKKVLQELLRNTKDIYYELETLGVDACNDPYIYFAIKKYHLIHADENYYYYSWHKNEVYDEKTFVYQEWSITMFKKEDNGGKLIWCFYSDFA